jgi:hypothetical protein
MEIHDRQAAEIMEATPAFLAFRCRLRDTRLVKTGRAVHPLLAGATYPEG